MKDPISEIASKTTRGPGRPAKFDGDMYSRFAEYPAKTKRQKQNLIYAGKALVALAGNPAFGYLVRSHPPLTILAELGRIEFKPLIMLAAMDICQNRLKGAAAIGAARRMRGAGKGSTERLELAIRRAVKRFCALYGDPGAAPIRIALKLVLLDYEK